MKKRGGLLNVVLYNSKRLHSMSENALALTRMERKVLVLSRDVFDLGQLIQEIILDFKVRLNIIYLVSNPHNKEYHVSSRGIRRKISGTR